MASRGGIPISIALQGPDLGKDFLDTPLKEENFIHEGYRKNPSPFWLWLAVAAAFLTLFWGTNAWIAKKPADVEVINKFTQVTNREFSLFFSQFPEYVKGWAKKKGEYFPAFSFSGTLSVAPSKADELVIAPAELLFLYHTWMRQVGKELVIRPISAPLFLTFLREAPMWQPRFWPQAPASYNILVASLEQGGVLKEDMFLDKNSLPSDVQQAFQAWRNSVMEAKQIEAFIPSRVEVQRFLERFPHYGRSYWQNVLYQSHPRYLRSFVTTSQPKKVDEAIEPQELAPFLLLALYNAQK